MRLVSVFVVLLLVIAAQPPAPALAEPPAEVVLVKFRPAAASENGARHIFDRWWAVSVPRSETAEQTLERMSRNPNVEAAQLNYRFELAGDSPSGATPLATFPNDPFYFEQDNLRLIGAPAVWAQGITGAGTTVAVVDTGTSVGPALGAGGIGNDLDCHLFINEYDAVTGEVGPGAAADVDGHGTHVAGTIAQCTDNAVGVAGAAFGANLMPIRVLGGPGNNTDMIAAGINWATTHGADVINLSLGFDCYPFSYPICSQPIIEDAIDFALAGGVVVVAAAGNDSTTSLWYPANRPDVIGVGAVDYRPSLTDYSTHGSQLNVVAPGGDFSRDDNGDGWGDGILQWTFSGTPLVAGSWDYFYYEGTSMAAPHVSATAALLKQWNPAIKPAEVKRVLEATALDLGLVGRDDSYGWGLIQADAALAAIFWSDVAFDRWSRPFVDAVYAAGITEGCGGGGGTAVFYCPGIAVSRAEMAAFVYRAVNPASEPPIPGTDPFPDVPKEAWFAGYIEWAAGEGIVLGYPDGSYRPERVVSRAEAAAFLYRSFNPGVEPPVPGTDPFPDVPRDAWFAGYVDWLAVNSIAAGFPDGTFHPQSSVSREEMATFLARAWGLVPG